ncbi:MAG: 30S ribosomal protein S3 [Candidatus Wildermuthbacteria bacterium]|nr:30S ribosomal protein S3 [Candidatus Wildermuthbacteria bacterium]
MAHKVHPKGFRLRYTQDWSSRWIRKKHAYVQTLREDFLIREYLERKLKDSAIEAIEIERFSGKVMVIIHTARPGLIIGRGGSGVEELRKGILRILLGALPKGSLTREVHLEIREIKNPWESAALTAQWIAQQLEKRVPFRRVLKQAIAKVMSNKAIKGVKVEIAGRLGGAEIARRETMREGRLPLQTLRSQIDFVIHEAQTTYGTIGIKVWLYKGETFE